MLDTKLSNLSFFVNSNSCLIECGVSSFVSFLSQHIVLFFYVVLLSVCVKSELCLLICVCLNCPLCVSVCLPCVLSLYIVCVSACVCVLVCVCVCVCLRDHLLCIHGPSDCLCIKQ